jgi:hypothetical protein
MVSLFGLFLTIDAKVPSKAEQGPLIDGWKNSLQKLRSEHSYFFSQTAHNDVLTEFEKYLNQMRGLGINVDSPDGWNALAGLRDPHKQRFDIVQPGSKGTTRADRFSPFKVPTPTPSTKNDFLNPTATGSVILDQESVNNALESLFSPQQTTVNDDSKCLEGDTTCTDGETTPPTTPPPTPQHLIPSVQGLESNRGASVLPTKTEGWCKAVLNEDFKVYPQRLLVDLDTGSVNFQDLECERHIERDDLVRVLPVTASLISDDKLRYDFAKLGCSWFYRPLDNPTKLPCVSQCTVIRDFIRDLDLNNASPAQLKDRAVLQTIAWPILLLAGQCEYTSFYLISDKFDECIHPEDYSVFKPFEETKLGRPTCSSYPEKGALCSGLLTNSYNDPSNTAIANLVGVATPLLRSLYALAPAHGDNQCVKAFAQQICSRYVMSCTEVPVTMVDAEGGVYAIKYALPVLAHQSVCQNYAKHCGSFIQTLASMQTGGDPTEFQAAISLLDPSCDSKSPVGATYECDGRHYSSTYDIFPRSSQYSMGLAVSYATIRTNNFTYATQYDQSKIIPFYPNVECPAPLVIPDSQDGPDNGRIGTTSCALPCPSILFTEGDYHAISTTALVITTVSLICAIFLVGSYIFFKEIRQGNYFLQFLLCLILICGAFSIGIYIRYSPSLSIQAKYCISNTQIATQGENVGCTIQAFIILFAISAISAFFASSGFDLFLRVVLQVEVRPHTQQDYLLNLGYFFWGWTVPLLLTTVAAATQSLGPADLGMFYCFVHGRANGTVPWATAYLPFMVQLFIGCVSLSTTIYQLVRVAKRQQEEEYERQAREHNYRSNSAPSLRLGNYIVPLMLELVFFLYLGWIVLFRAVAHFLEKRWVAATTSYANCLLVNKPIADYFSMSKGLGPSSLDCGARPKTITLATWWFHQIFLASLGIITFFVLGSQRVYYQLWAAVLGYYLNIPSLLVWAATTQQAKIYGKRLARARRARARKLRLQGRTEELLKEKAAAEGKEIVEQIKEQDKLVKEKLRLEQEEKQKKEREKQQLQQQQNLNMIAPHLRPLYMIQQRPRRVLPSLVDTAQNPDAQIGPKPIAISDIYTVFNVQNDNPGGIGGGGGGRRQTQYDDYMMDYE